MVQAICTFIPAVLRFPEYSSGCALHAQRLYQQRVIVETARLIVGCETPKFSAISTWTRFLRR